MKPLAIHMAGVIAYRSMVLTVCFMPPVCMITTCLADNCDRICENKSYSLCEVSVLNFYDLIYLLEALSVNSCKQGLQWGQISIRYLV